MSIGVEFWNLPDSFRYCKNWTKNVKTSEMQKEKKNEKSTNKQKKCLHNIETLEKYELPSKC